MIEGYAYARSIWLALASAIFVAALGLYSWRRGDVPGARALAIGCLFIGLWLLGIVAQAAADDISAKIAWRKFQGLVQLPALTANICFVLEYAYLGHWLTRRNLILLSIPPLLVVPLAATNDLHHLLWLGFGFDGSVIPVRGSVNWILTGYAFGLILVGITALVRLFIRSPQHRWPVVLIIAAAIVVFTMSLLDTTRPAFHAPLDIVILALLFHVTVYGIALFGFHMLDPMTVAGKLVIEQMPDGMAVFDARGRIANLNPAAAGILHTTEARARGKTLEELLPEFPGLTADLAGVGAAPVEIGLDGGEQARRYALDLSPLEDFRGSIIGHLLLLRDVTEQHRAHARILEEQWAQATLQERVLLADELHDGLSQNLAFLNLQAQTAQVYLQAERNRDAQATLTRLAEVARGLQSDMRELIGNLLIVILPSEGFCETLTHVVTRFEEQNGLAVQLEIDPDAAVLCDPSRLAPAAGVQLVRIVQEALANVRKHAGNPSRISVRLELASGQMRLTVADNGVGFDPDAAGDDSKHFGLRVMGQRAARIGGQLAVHSAPGQGTQVEVCVPLDRPPEQPEKAGG